MAKLVFIEARRKIDLNDNFSKELSGLQYRKIGLVSSIQYADILLLIKKLLENQGKEVFLAKGGISKHEGQILGCDVSAALNVEKKVDAFLFVGTGLFHPTNLALKTKKKIFIFNPEAAKLSELNMQDIENLKRKQDAAIKKFLSLDEMGILVSAKKGQFKMEKALELKKKIENRENQKIFGIPKTKGFCESGKKAFIFISDNVDKGEFENFSCRLFINTACPGLSINDPRIVNAEDINSYL
jgi:2-(3-amino-3-carboxypropyl)histidine synthase